MSLTLFVFVVSSVCADNNHVRTWTVTRFRGMISTQPGSTPLTSFKILSLDDVDGHGGCSAGTEIGKKHHGSLQLLFTVTWLLSSRGRTVLNLCWFVYVTGSEVIT